MKLVRTTQETEHTSSSLYHESASAENQFKMITVDKISKGDSEQLTLFLIRSMAEYIRQ